MSKRKLDLALTLGIAIELLEILLRMPRWLILVAALLVYSCVYMVYLHPWWTVAAVLAVVAMSGVRRRIPGRLR